MSRPKSQLRFQTMPCARCKADRVIGTPCSECGAKGRTGEVNADVVTRRTSVRNVNAARASQLGLTGGPASDGLPSHHEIADFLTEFIHALTQILHSNGSVPSVGAMVGALARLDDMRERCARVPPLRPHLSKQRFMLSVIDILDGLWPVYAEALSTPTTETARMMIKRGQELIDNAGINITNYSKLEGAVKAYEDLSIPSLFERALQALSLSYPEIPLVNIGQRGAAEASATLGVPVDSGHGVQYLVLKSIASVHFDEHHFAKLLDDGAVACEHSPYLREISKSPMARASLAQSSRLLFESLTSFEAILQKEEDKEALMRRLIKFYGEVYEDVGGPLFAWYNLLTGLKSQPYEKLISHDATALATNLSKAAAAEAMAAGAVTYLRNAAQHGSSFILQGDSVEFRLRSYRETKTSAEVIDDIFAFFEVLSAMSFSLSNALTNIGQPITTSENDATYMGFSAFRLAKLFLEQKGTTLLSAAETKDAWHFGIDDAVDVFQLGIVLALGAPPGLSSVTVSVTNSSEPLVVPLDEYKRFAKLSEQATTPKDHLLGILNLRQRCTRKGKSLLTAGDLNFAAASLGLHLLLDKPDAATHLRQVMKLAELLGQQDLVDLLRMVFSQFRNPEASAKRRLSSRLNDLLNKSSAPEIPETTSVRVVMAA